MHNKKPKIGEVYVVKFHPSFGRELKRFRPAVIVSNSVNESDDRFTLISPLTSSSKVNNNKTELIIENEVLDTRSVLLAWYLKTIDVERLEHRIGRLSQKDIKKMKEVYARLF